MPFNSTMIREKCIIQDAALGKQGSKVLSNRLVLPLPGGDTLVVRGHNMHSVARMAARLYNKALEGPLSQQRNDIDWATLWNEIHNGAHLANSPNNWISAFVGGKTLFASGEQHPFLDVIEQQVTANGGSYDMNVMMALETFKAAGHPLMEIDHSTNVAMILSIEDGIGRCGLIYRHPRRTTTFSFTASPSGNSPAAGQRTIEQEIAGMLEMSANFLESIQVCYAIAAESAKGADQDFGKEMDMRTRLSDMRKAIDGFEQGMSVTYRPERPDFNRFLQEAQILLTKRARA